MMLFQFPVYIKKSDSNGFCSTIDANDVETFAAHFTGSFVLANFFITRAMDFAKCLMVSIPSVSAAISFFPAEPGQHRYSSSWTLRQSYR